jgi:hypothetical protein
MERRIEALGKNFKKILGTEIGKREVMDKQVKTGYKQTNRK